MPAIEATAKSMLVTLFSTKERFEQVSSVRLNHRQKKALAFVNQHGLITNRDYRTLFPEITSRTALNDLRELADKDILQKKVQQKAHITKFRNNSEIKRKGGELSDRLCMQRMAVERIVEMILTRHRLHVIHLTSFAKNDGGI
jgi:hypothetical protein